MQNEIEIIVNGNDAQVIIDNFTVDSYFEYLGDRCHGAVECTDVEFDIISVNINEMGWVDKIHHGLLDDIKEEINDNHLDKLVKLYEN